MAILTTVLAYLQLLAGAVVRHSPYLTGDSAAVIFQMAVYFHLLLALAVTVHVATLAWHGYRNQLETIRSSLLAGLVIVQVFLGASTWLVKYGLPRWTVSVVGDWTFVNTADDAFQAGIVTFHVAVGSLILVTALAIALRAARQLRIGFPQFASASNKGLGVAL